MSFVVVSTLVSRCSTVLTHENTISEPGRVHTFVRSLVRPRWIGITHAVQAVRIRTRTRMAADGTWFTRIWVATMCDPGM